MTTYKPSFPCKVISSFFDNYYKIHYYEIIKLITYRRIIIKSKLEKNIYRLFEMFQIFYSIPLYESIEFCNIKMKEHNFINIDLNVKLDDIYEAIINLNNMINSEDNIYNKFYYFLVITKLLNIEFKKVIMPPLNLEERLSNIKDQNVKYYFLKSWLFNMYKDSSYKPIKNDLINLYKRYAEDFKLLGVENIFIFGSVNQETDNIYSDVDLIVKYNNNVNKDYVINYIKRLNKENFNKNTDILEFELGLSLHNINDCTPLFQ